MPTEPSRDPDESFATSTSISVRFSGAPDPGGLVDPQPTPVANYDDIIKHHPPTSGDHRLLFSAYNEVAQRANLTARRPRVGEPTGRLDRHPFELEIGRQQTTTDFARFFQLWPRPGRPPYPCPTSPTIDADVLSFPSTPTRPARRRLPCLHRVDFNHIERVSALYLRPIRLSDALEIVAASLRPRRTRSTNSNSVASSTE